MRRLFAAATAFVSLTGTPAMACSLSNWNIYDGFGRPPEAELFSQATTIDWVEIDTPPPASCPRNPDWILDREVLDADEYPEDARPEYCRDPLSDQNAPLFEARVIERLKGASDERFALMRYQAPWRDEHEPGSDWLPGRWIRFSDLRHASATAAITVSVGARAKAEGRHADIAFWDNGTVEFDRDLSHSCGGNPTLDPEMRYIVFRDAIGGVLALEPVLYGDDRFLERLRLAAGDPAVFGETSYPVAEFFRTATAMVEAEVEVCTGDTGPRASYRSEQGRLRVARGDRASENLLFTQQEDVGETTRTFNDLWDFYGDREEVCPVGERVLLARFTLDHAPPWSGASDWVEARFPGWQAGVVETLRETGEQDEISPIELYVGDPSPRSAHARPIRIHDGRIRLADIPTGLALDGPEWIPVDQAFAWFEQGRTNRP